MNSVGAKLLDPLQEFPLKERKFARTRTKLIFGFLELLEAKPYNEIKIIELCQYAEISEPTFYNYFPEKDELILHYLQIWSLQVTVFAENNRLSNSGYGLLQSLFRYTAKESKKNPRILLEIISFQTKYRKRPHAKELTQAERTLLFPKHPEIGTLPIGGIELIMENAMNLAIQNKELPSNTNWKSLSLTIASIFFGIPVLAFQMKENLESLWLKSLEYIWLGAGGKIQKINKKVSKV